MSAVVLLDYCPEWIDAFGRAADELRAVFGAGVGIEHIGSTAVPGLCAKPVLDILAGAVGVSYFERCIEPLGRLGYRYRPEHEATIPDRRYFVREGSQDMRIHLHCVERDHTLWRRHLAFRDALRTNSSLATEYATLKRDLARRHAQDKAAYTEAKGPFIQRVLASLHEPGIEGTGPWQPY